MGSRRIDAFFYGLFMDVEILAKSRVEPRNVRRGWVQDFALRIGQRATLVSSKGARAYGMIMWLSHEELDSLYRAPGLDHYRPEAVLVQTMEGVAAPALCYNLLEPPSADERNPEYALKLQGVLKKLNFPSEYVSSIA